MLLSDLVSVSASVASTRSRKKKVETIAACLSALTPRELAIGVDYLTGELPQGKIGLGPAAVYRNKETEGTTSSSDATPIPLKEVDRALSELGQIRGPGSTRKREEAWRSLLLVRSPPEQEFLRRLCIGELRQGALKGVLLEAIATAYSVPSSAVRRAFMLTGSLPKVAQIASNSAEEGLRALRIEFFRPLEPMLAKPAEDMNDAMKSLATPSLDPVSLGLEYKVDGVRVQVHRRDREVRVYSRNLQELTDRVPELVAAVLEYPASCFILDGETVALDHQGRPLPFQVSMRRLGRNQNLSDLQESLPLSTYFFDCLHAGGTDLIDRTSAERWQEMASFVPESAIIPRIRTDRIEDAQAFFQKSLADGHEGVMAKSISAPYEAGSRGGSWLKIKTSHSMDLVIIAAEWGSGRRKGYLSNLHLAARDPDEETFVMLGKTFKGLTDEMLAYQTQKLLEIETERKGHVVHVRPELVAEIAFSDVQQSSHYPGGVALRFARVKAFRPDKSPEQADTIDSIRALCPSP